jgi:hypothetical protein
MNVYDIRFIIYYNINDIKTLNRCFQVDKLSQSIYHDDYYWQQYFKKHNLQLYNNDNWIKSYHISMLTKSIEDEFTQLPLMNNGICINVNIIPNVLSPLFHKIMNYNIVPFYEIRIIKIPKLSISLLCIVSDTCYEGYKNIISTLETDIDDKDINGIIYHLIYHNDNYIYRVYSY